MREEAEAMARVDSKERQSEGDDNGTHDEGCGEEIMREDKGNRLAALLGLRARDIMQRETIWCGPEESIEAVLAKMRRAGCDEVIVGRDGAAAGIAARSELKGRLSAPVRRVMVKWKKGGRDATLGMPVKFAMIRGVRSIGEGTSVTALMKSMRQSGWRALAVVDGQGKVRGLVTACSVLKIRALLRLESNPRLLSARAGRARDAVGAAKAEIKVFDVLRPSGVFRRAGKKSKSQVSTS
jgi:CBS domain-containing protein